MSRMYHENCHRHHYIWDRGHWLVNAPGEGILAAFVSDRHVSSIAIAEPFVNQKLSFPHCKGLVPSAPECQHATQPLIPLAGLDAAIHVFLRPEIARLQDVGGRIKSG